MSDSQSLADFALQFHNGDGAPQQSLADFAIGLHNGQVPGNQPQSNMDYFSSLLGKMGLPTSNNANQFNTKYQGYQKEPFIENLKSLSNQGVQNFKQGLLSNAPTQNMAQSAIRTLPAAAATMLLGPEAGLLSYGLAGAAGEAARQGAVMGAGSTPTPGQVVMQSASGGIGQMAGKAASDSIIAGLAGLYKLGATRIVPAFRQIFGVSEPATERALAGKASDIITKQNADEGTALIALQGAQDALRQNKVMAGQKIGEAEDLIANSSEGQKMFDPSEIAGYIRKELERPVFDPVVRDYGGANAERVKLEGLANDLESGQMTTRQLVGIRKNLDREVDWQPGPLPKPSDDYTRVIKNVNNQLRGTLSNAYSDTLKPVYAAYSKASDLYDQYRTLLGGNSPNALNDVNTLKKLGTQFRGTSQEARNIILDFDNQIAQTEQYANKIFDHFTAKEFGQGAPAQLSPSSISLRGLATLGLTSPKVGAALLKGGQAMAPGMPALGQGISQGTQYGTPMLIQALGNQNQ